MRGETNTFWLIFIFWLQILSVGLMEDIETPIIKLRLAVKKPKTSKYQPTFIVLWRERPLKSSNFFAFKNARRPALPVQLLSLKYNLSLSMNVLVVIQKQMGQWSARSVCLRNKIKILTFVFKSSSWAGAKLWVALRQVKTWILAGWIFIFFALNWWNPNSPPPSLEIIPVVPDLQLFV